jgi:LmbE family N-acetylglucosaminyl deacetylase
MGNWLRTIMEALATDVTATIAGRRCLVLAPHPDDEVLGCGGMIARKVRHGDQVSVAFLTDGRHGFPNPPIDAGAVRHREALAATSALGLKPDAVTFLGIEDGTLGKHLDAVTLEVRSMVRDLQANDLFVPYRRDYHADHQAAWRIGVACLDDGMLMYEYPIWYGPWLWPRLRGRARLAAISHLREVPASAKIAIADVLATKRLALSAYRSQVPDFMERGTWGRGFISNFLRDYELFFVSGGASSARRQPTWRI